MGKNKDLPPGVPEENEYHSLHWTVILAFLSFSYHQVKNFVKPAKINNSEDFLIKNYGKQLTKYTITYISYMSSAYLNSHSTIISVRQATILIS